MKNNENTSYLLGQVSYKAPINNISRNNSDSSFGELAERRTVTRVVPLMATGLSTVTFPAGLAPSLRYLGSLPLTGCVSGEPRQP